MEYGHIDKFRTKIPWSSLRTSNIHAHIDNIHLVFKLNLAGKVEDIELLQALKMVIIYKIININIYIFLIYIYIIQ
jgi:hypothetical protein